MYKSFPVSRAVATGVGWASALRSLPLLRVSASRKQVAEAGGVFFPTQPNHAGKKEPVGKWTAPRCRADKQKPCHCFPLWVSPKGKAVAHALHLPCIRGLHSPQKQGRWAKACHCFPFSACLKGKTVAGFPARSLSLRVRGGFFCQQLHVAGKRRSELPGHVLSAQREQAGRKGGVSFTGDHESPMKEAPRHLSPGGEGEMPEGVCHALLTLPTPLRRNSWLQACLSPSHYASMEENEAGYCTNSQNIGKQEQVNLLIRWIKYYLYSFP